MRFIIQLLLTSAAAFVVAPVVLFTLFLLWVALRGDDAEEEISE